MVATSLFLANCLDAIEPEYGAIVRGHLGESNGRICHRERYSAADDQWLNGAWSREQRVP